MSCVPASLNAAETATDAPTGIRPEVTATVPNTGFAFAIITVVFATTAALTPSLTVNAAATTASSSHRMLGVRVATPPVVQVVPESFSVGVRVQVVTRWSASGSLAVPDKLVVVPSVPKYGPPAEAVGGPFTSTPTVRVVRPPSSSCTVTVMV